MMKKSTLEKILKATKLAGKNKKVLGSKIYVDIIASREYSLLSVLTEIVGFHLPEEIIQETYKKEIGESLKFVELYEATGVRPPEQVIQEAYLSCTGSTYLASLSDYKSTDISCVGSFTQFKLLFETFKSIPSSQVMYGVERSCYFGYTHESTRGPDLTVLTKDNEKWNKFKRLFKKAGVDF